MPARPLAAVALAVIAAPISAAEPVALFNGTDLTGWSFDAEAADAEVGDVWSVENGLLVSRGRPISVLRTDADYRRYRLDIEWRWAGTPGNGGVLIHCGDPRVMNVWPRSLEVQLRHENAGDFWVKGCDIDVPAERLGVGGVVKGRRHMNFNDGAEKPAGEWNAMTIHADAGTVLVEVNGEVVNYGENATVTSGAIGLQAEGASMEFRKVLLTPAE